MKSEESGLAPASEVPASESPLSELPVSQEALEEALEPDVPLDRLQRLARGLLADQNVADDVVQDVCLLWLERPPRLRQSPRSRWAWLRQVTRTLARQSVRASWRRTRREREVATPVETPSFLRTLELREDVERVRKAIFRMPDPDRSLLRMRLVEGLGPAEIADRIGIQPAATRMRLTRAMRRLQASLEPQAEPRTSWSLALFLFPFGKRSPSTAWTAGWTVAATGLVAATLALVWPREPEPEHAVPAVAQAVRQGSLYGAILEASQSKRSPVDARRRAAASAPLEPLLGAALWIDGRPAAGVEVQVVGSDCQACGPEASCADHRVRTRPDGSFRFEERPPTSGLCYVSSADEGLVSVLSGAIDFRGVLGPPSTVLARARRLEGRVLDAEGLPIAGATLSWELPEDMRHRVAWPIDLMSPFAAQVESEAGGGFTFRRLPDLPAARLVARALGYETASVGVGSTDVLEVRLEALPPAVRGYVLDASGRPVSGAWVVSGEHRAPTDPGGSFLVHLDAERETLRVVHANHAALEIPVAEARAMRFELRLEPQPAPLRGRVVDDAGRPVAGLEVFRRRVEAAFTDASGTWTFEGLAQLPPRLLPAGAITDADGRFALSAWEPGPRRVAAIDPNSLLLVEAELLPGAPEATLVLPTDSLILAQNKRFLDAHGAPLAGVQAYVVRDGATVEGEGRPLYTQRRARHVGFSDASGSVFLNGLAPDVVLQCEGRDLFPTRWELGHAPQALVLPRPRHLRIVDAPPGVHRAEIFDAGGAQLSAGLNWDPSEGTEMGTFVEGRTALLTVPDNAVAAALVDASGNQHRVELDFREERVLELSVSGLQIP